MSSQLAEHEQIPLSRDEVISRLRWLANVKPGEPFPDFLVGPGCWGPPMSKLAREVLILLGERP